MAPNVRSVSVEPFFGVHTSKVSATSLLRMQAVGRACVVSLLILSVGCTTARRVPVNTGSTPVHDVKRGDVVHVVMANGQRARVWIAGVTTEYIEARDYSQSRYYFRDMKSLAVERGEFSKRKTIGLVVGIAAGVAFMVMLAYASALGAAWG